ncbi:uncharacterized protein PV09_00023 [Verruconis gallopava]|uniref:Thioredoxin domain-containing protein n=1 Tax=Verruconis gallopava TaxID=253628 RepID=A0A0D2ARF8_9PEZI|nr:uncharacterized protein PV09_00023 [Verruconis gallopava]KIW09075.1 hypothetical protein PV09_00023 [Verruconis gallopava]
MASIDPRVAALVDNRAADSDDEDALLASLEEDDDDHALAALREQRMQQLHDEVLRAKRMREAGTGSYVEIRDEKEVMDITTSTKLAVVHFFKPDFGRCGVMDRHLEALAPKHFDTRFVKINVDNAPFLVAKLKIQVLPCVIAFVDGVGQDRIIGFEGLGQGDKFTTVDLEARLLRCGVLTRAKMSDDVAVGRMRTGRANMNRGKPEASDGDGYGDDDHDDDDWD